MKYGYPFLFQDVDDYIDPIVDNVLEKNIKGAILIHLTMHRSIRTYGTYFIFESYVRILAYTFRT